MQKCANCGHVLHPSGTCAIGDCSCATNQPVDGSPDGKVHPDASNPVQAATDGSGQFADGDPVGGEPVGEEPVGEEPMDDQPDPDQDDLGDGSDPTQLVQSVDATIDAAIANINRLGDTTTLPPELQEAIALIRGADVLLDGYLAEQGIPDPDADQAPAVTASVRSKSGYSRARRAGYAPAPPPMPTDGDAPPADADTADDVDQPSQVQTLAGAVDDALDQAASLLHSLDLGSLDPHVQSFIALVDAADASIDAVCSLLGVDDPDEDVTVNPDSDPVQFAEAADAAIVAARNLSEGSDWPTDAPAEVAQAVDLVHQADDQSGDLLAALNAPDPDVEEGTDEGDGVTAAGAPDAAAPEGVPANMRFRMPVMVLEGVDTGDGRYITPGALTWRDLPLPTMAITETGMGHDGAQLVGKLTSISRIDASGMTNPKTNEPYGEGAQALMAEGVFTNEEYAKQVGDLIRDEFLRGVSVDLSDVKAELELLDEDGKPMPEADNEEDLLDILFMDGDFRDNVIEGRVMGVTICPFPAFEGAYIELDDGTQTPALQASVRPSQSGALHMLDEFGVRECKPCQEGTPLVASAGPMLPPTSWFEDPELTEVTPLTITDDGRIYGHLAAWGTCHTGVSGRCVTAPRSLSDYAYFRTGAVKTAEGDLVAVGPITLGTGHAGLNLNSVEALAHYDNTGTAVADVAVGEDKHGIWFSGAVRPDVNELQIRQFRAASLSGDWRSIGGRLELVAALGVNAPGFPVTRARVASGATVSLVAAGGREVVRRASEQGQISDADRNLMREFLTEVKASKYRDRVRAPRKPSPVLTAAKLRERVHRRNR